MATFTLTWTPNITANVTAQRASYRLKSVGGAYSTSGFSPSNDLSTAATTTTRAGLDSNKVYEFTISNICEEGGPSANVEGSIEQIVFQCVTPDITKDSDSATCTVSGLPIDITKVRFRLRLTSNNSLVSGPTIVPVVAGAASVTVTGLTPNTDYYFETELYAVVEGVETISSNSAYLDNVCGPYGFLTDALAECPAPSNLSVNSVAL